MEMHTNFISGDHRFNSGCVMLGLQRPRLQGLHAVGDVWEHGFVIPSDAY